MCVCVCTYVSVCVHVSVYVCIACVWCVSVCVHACVCTRACVIVYFRVFASFGSRTLEPFVSDLSGNQQEKSSGSIKSFIN